MNVWQSIRGFRDADVEVVELQYVLRLCRHSNSTSSKRRCDEEGSQDSVRKTIPKPPLPRIRREGVIFWSDGHARCGSKNPARRTVHVHRGGKVNAENMRCILF
jgi:hypothetical protein